VAIESFGVRTADAGSLRSGAPAEVWVRYHTTRDLRVRWGFCLLTADLETTISCDGRLDACLLPAGGGELTGTVPRLPLSGGRYAIRVTIMDPETELPFALGGFGHAPCLFEVQMPGSQRNNYRMLMKDLIALEDLSWDVRFDRPEDAAAHSPVGAEPTWRSDRRA
jgi:hypothetical protein